MTDRAETARPATPPHRSSAALEPDFAGTIGRTVSDSTPAWPAPEHPAGPNVVVILLDDVGFAQLGCYGSSINTPNIDALAANGLLYRNFHATALCSPTRASLLTGRNHHSVGMGFLAAFDTGYPNYRATVSPTAATFPELLRDAGYGTYALGKWHLTPPGHMTSAGPFTHWPTQRGFDRYYGFLGGEDDQWRPELWYDQHRVQPDAGENYHLSEDLVARGEEFLADHVTARPDDPFLLYLAFGACHAPHQAPRRHIDAYRGAFDHGWDVERERVLARQIERGIVPPGTRLAPRNPGVQPWEELTDEQRGLYARMQEVFAGFMTHTDEQVGRLVGYLTRHGLVEDTLIVLASDNGASAEGGQHGTANEYRWFLHLPDPLDDIVAARDELGGRRSHGHYPTGWAQAGNTPGKYYKRFAYGGGVRVPLIMHWPHGLTGGPAVREQFHHVIDLAPTVLEICGVSAPGTYRGVEQMPLHGTSMAYTFDEPEAPSRRTVQYFETAGYRGIISGDWKAVADHRPGDDFDADHWELYRISDDVAETVDLSADYPDKAAELTRLWWQEAERFGVLPLDDRMQDRMAAQDPAADRVHYELLPGARLLNGVAGPSFSDREFHITATVQPWQHGHDGVLLAWGHRATGFTLHVADARLSFDLNLGGRHTEITATAPIPEGTRRLHLRVSRSPAGSDPDGHHAEPRGSGAVAVLLADERVMAEGPVPSLIPGGMGLLPTQCGYNAPSPVVDSYPAPNRYRGELDRVVIDLQPRGDAGRQADWFAELRHQ